MKKLALAMLCLSLTLPGCPSPSGAPSSHVDGPAARALVSAGALLVDVRTPEEFAEGHLEGARNVPVDELDRRLAELPRDRTLVVYCASGMRSARAAERLSRAGFAVRDLGTLSAWNR